MFANPVTPYPARLEIDYVEQHDRLTTLLRLIWVIPILIILFAIDAAGGSSFQMQDSETIRNTGGSAASGIAFATAMMILFRQRYPRWWFDFQLALARFSARVGAYLALMRDEYPSTEDEQAVHLELDYPDATQLNRWLPLVKWLLAIPHYLVLVILGFGAVFAVIFAWFAILITGRQPRWVFDYLLGVGRWALRVQAYMLFMLTDEYPPFSRR